MNRYDYPTSSPQALVAWFRNLFRTHESQQTAKKQTRYTYNEGPMFFLGQQIVRAMQDAGYPAHIFEHYREASRQELLYARGRSKARAWQSPHQYGEAVDIVHPDLFWEVSPEYWEALASCVRVVAAKFDVELNHGHHWKFTDSAHVELRDWRETVYAKQKRLPVAAEKDHRFRDLLPSVWANKFR